MDIVITREQFIKALDQVRQAHDYQTGLNFYYQSSGCEGFLFQPDCTNTVITLLHQFFGPADREEWISYFIFELDFGRKAADRKDKPESSANLGTAGKLYDFLTSYRS